MSHSRRNLESIINYLTRFEHVVEIGIGRRTDLAVTLENAGVSVVATDITQREVPAGVEFVEDDIVDPDLAVYADADAIYARNLPPELHRPALEVAREVDTAFYFTTLGGDQPTVPVERKTVQEGTLYVAHDGDEQST
ncbi:UPF0146 family protein [Natronolimnobius baerhuensis]|uniref:UPF0146 family protein n=1 Tax=Natronolimnobius baerhuensis TaxID=253108 RepID=UPI00159524D0|nr:UPF0146 family protein [Natronolimnobius baerhuensis]